MAEKRYMKCTSGFLLPGGRQIRSGDLVEAGDPMFKDHKGLESKFEPVTQEIVEQATRAPGEVRIITTRRPRSSSKAAEKPAETPKSPEK